MANESNLKPFKKGDARINRKGRPKSFDELRTLTQAIAHEVARKPTGEPLLAADGHALTVAEAILRSWAHSRVPALQIRFMEICFGKVPDSVELSGAVATVGMTLDQWREEAERRRAAAAAVLEDDDGDD
jgi:hypothetical protein